MTSLTPVGSWPQRQTAADAPPRPTLTGLVIGRPYKTNPYVVEKIALVKVAKKGIGAFRIQDADRSLT